MLEIRFTLILLTFFSDFWLKNLLIELKFIFYIPDNLLTKILATSPQRLYPILERRAYPLV